MTFILAHNNNVRNTISLMGLPFNPPTNFLERINQNKLLMIKNHPQVERIYNNNSLMGHFSLFFSQKLNKDIIIWTNSNIQFVYQPLITSHELSAYLGLEMAMSIFVLVSIKEY